MGCHGTQTREIKLRGLICPAMSVQLVTCAAKEMQERMQALASDLRAQAAQLPSDLRTGANAPAAASADHNETATSDMDDHEALSSDSEASDDDEDLEQPSALAQSADAPAAEAAPAADAEASDGDESDFEIDSGHETASDAEAAGDDSNVRTSQELSTYPAGSVCFHCGFDLALHVSQQVCKMC